MVFSFDIHQGTDDSSQDSLDDEQSSISNDSESSCSTTSNSSNDDRIIEELIAEKMGPVDLPKKYHLPYTICSFIAKHRNSSTANGNRITVLKLIKFMIRYDMTPIKTSSMYSLCKRFKNGKLPVDANWTNLGRRGRKSYLTSIEFRNLVRKVRKETSGGKAMSSNDLKIMIETHIIESFHSRKFISQLPTKIPMSTLNTYASILKLQSLFSIFTNVQNKTESRSVAEWSLRSTIAYSMVVATNHFIPGAKQLVYHPKRKDLCKESTKLWDLPETSYNTMVVNVNCCIELQPVLPNLVTTTDEVK